MSDSSQPADLTAFLVRVRAGDLEARNDLIRAAQRRLESLARKMLRGFPSVIRWADTGDVFTNSVLRLLRALEATEVADTRGFLNLAATVIRRELIDLARHYRGAHGIGANHASVGGEDAPAFDPAEPASREEDLEKWTAFHEAVEQLSVEVREVFSLAFYHKWEQEQIAELFHVDARTIRRRLRSAVQELNAMLGDQLPSG